MLLIASFFLFFFVCGGVIWGLLGVLLWFCLPWIDLLTRMRKLRMPLQNRLDYPKPPKDSLFPNASAAVNAMEEAHFDHVGDSGWAWAGMEQFYRIYWHPEEYAVGTVCLCERDHIAFAYVSITSVDLEGNVYRTTNFPFSPTLKTPKHIHWNHVPCAQSCFDKILLDHKAFLTSSGMTSAVLSMPDPDSLVDQIEAEMQAQIQFNLEQGLIQPSEDIKDTFRYSWKGLIFLWKQLVKDMIRLC